MSVPEDKLISDIEAMMGLCRYLSNKCRVQTCETLFQVNVLVRDMFFQDFLNGRNVEEHPRLRNNAFRVYLTRIAKRINTRIALQFIGIEFPINQSVLFYIKESDMFFPHNVGNISALLGALRGNRVHIDSLTLLFLTTQAMWISVAREGASDKDVILDANIVARVVWSCIDQLDSFSKEDILDTIPNIMFNEIVKNP